MFPSFFLDHILNEDHVMLRMLGGGILMGLCLMSGARGSEELAQRCAQQVQQTIERATIAAAEETRECVRQIVELQRQGRHEAAIQVARECLRRATARTENAAAYVNQICDRCIAELLDRGEPMLARRIDQLCDEAIATLRSILQRQREAILEALQY